MPQNAPEAAKLFKKVFGGAIIAAGGYTPDSARTPVASGCPDGIAFGRLFISNPNLPEHQRPHAELNHYHRATFYGGAEVGYTDYPFLATSTREWEHDSGALAHCRDEQLSMESRCRGQIRLRVQDSLRAR
jgi:2,4-dienoyl-CoA reductase-like NADH-dependent reductase (Old Yellow Enzyme family)